MGSDTDIVICDPKKVLFINSGDSQSDYNPYESMITTRMVETTILRREILVKNRKLVGSMKSQFIRRE